MRDDYPVLRVLVTIAIARTAARAVRALFGGMRRLAWRWRRILTPLWIGTLTWVFGALGHRYWPTLWWSWLVLVPLAVVLVLPEGRRRRSVRTKVAQVVLTDQDRLVLTRPVERVYAAVLVLVLVGYLVLRTRTGGTELTALLWSCAVLVLGGSWWGHRRIRTSGRADRYARKWSGIAKGTNLAPELVPLARSRVVRAVGSKGVSRLRVRLAGGLTAEHAARAAGPVASFLGLRPGSVYTQEDQAQASHVWFVIVGTHPWKARLPHPLPAVLSTTLAERPEFAMGLYSDGRCTSYRVQHTFVVGNSGAGKSVWLESLLRHLLAYQDVVLVGIDMAGGATLGLWRRVLALPLAEDVDAATWTLDRILATIEVRERRLGLDKEAGGEADEFQPTPHNPWLVLIIDEYPDLIAAGGAPVVRRLNRIAKRGRKAGFKFVFLSQNASKPDTGTKEIQSQARCTISFQLDQHADRVLWGGLRRAGWHSTSLKVGQYLQRDDDHPTPEVAKGWWTSPRERRQAIDATAGRLPVLESEAWAALTGTDGPLVVVGVEVDPLVEALRDGPQRAADLASATGMSRATVFRRLRGLREAGQARSSGGVWTLV